MKKISEMTLEELQDHALQLQSQNATLEAEKAAAAADIEELRKTNLLLQNRNNELFMRVEQQGAQTQTQTDTEQDSDPAPESCEDFAARMMKGVYNR